jgi:hypothetical protein
VPTLYFQTHPQKRLGIAVSPKLLDGAHGDAPRMSSLSVVADGREDEVETVGSASMCWFPCIK